MDLKKIMKVQNDLEHIECEPNLQLSREQQQQPQYQPAAKRKCFNEHLNEVSSAAINENNASDEMQPKHHTFPLNDGRPVIYVETGLQTMNEDCLREICQYLNLFDMVQLGQTCMHLESFAQRVIFPKKVKLIVIEYGPIAGFIIKLDHKYSTKSLTVLTNTIKYLGRFIEDFKYLYQGYLPEDSDVWRSIVQVIHHCKHLKTLTIGYVLSHSNQVHEFQELIGSLTSLKVLNVLYCEDILSNWSANIKQNLTIEKLSIQSRFEMEINDNFLEYFKNVSSLHLAVTRNACSASRILKHFGHSLKRLKLSCYRPQSVQSVVPIISKNLTNLEHLKVALWRGDFIDLPHLKSVQLFYSNSISTVLRKLSEHGMIEALELYVGIFTSDGTNEPPLIFNRLHTIKYGLFADSSIFIAMANAKVPALHTVEITSSSDVVLPEVLKFVQSKKTIKSIHLKLTKLVILPFEFWSQLIDILREPCAPNREFIHLRISSEPIIEKQTWKMLKDNRHLLKVEQERKCLKLIIN